MDVDPGKFCTHICCSIKLTWQKFLTNVVSYVSFPTLAFPGCWLVPPSSLRQWLRSRNSKPPDQMELPKPRLPLSQRERRPSPLVSNFILYSLHIFLNSDFLFRSFREIPQQNRRFARHSCERRRRQFYYEWTRQGGPSGTVRISGRGASPNRWSFSATPCPSAGLRHTYGCLQRFPLSSPSFRPRLFILSFVPTIPFQVHWLSFYLDSRGRHMRALPSSRVSWLLSLSTLASFSLVFEVSTRS